jgi:hypothetical protein
MAFLACFLVELSRIVGVSVRGFQNMKKALGDGIVPIVAFAIHTCWMTEAALIA